MNQIEGYRPRSLLPPSGLWHMTEFRVLGLAGDFPFAYACGPEDVAIEDVGQFSDMVSMKYTHVGFKLTGRIMIQTLGSVHCRWGDVAWTNEESTIFTLPYLADKKAGNFYHVGRLGRLTKKPRFSGPPLIVSVSDRIRFPVESFCFELSGHYINVYSSLTIPKCDIWLMERLNEPSLQYTVMIDRDEVHGLEFQSPVCPTCYGLHHAHECAFNFRGNCRENHCSDMDTDHRDDQQVVNILKLMKTITVSNTEKAANKVQVSNTVMIVKAPKAVNVSQAGELATLQALFPHQHLFRSDLVNAIIRRVLDTHFILVGFSSPNCSIILTIGRLRHHPAQEKLPCCTILHGLLGNSFPQRLSNKYSRLPTGDFYVLLTTTTK